MSPQVAQFCPLMHRQLDADEPVPIGLFVTQGRHLTRQGGVDPDRPEVKVLVSAFHRQKRAPIRAKILDGRGQSTTQEKLDLFEETIESRFMLQEQMILALERDEVGAGNARS